MNIQAFALLLFLSMLAACNEKETPPAPQARMVLAHQVEIGAGFNHAEYSGEVKPRHETALAFRVGGKLIERRVELGDRVVAGQVLARLDPADLAQAQKSAAALLAAAEADRAFAQAELERYRGLKAQQFVSTAALDAKETAFKAAEEGPRRRRAEIAGQQPEWLCNVEQRQQRCGCRCDGGSRPGGCGWSAGAESGAHG